MLAFFHQTFEPHDLIVIGLLIVLEGLLSMDNALVLGLLARRLPKALRGKALTYGLIGAFIFRLIAICIAAFILHWRWAKLLGGLYLIYVAVKHFILESTQDPDRKIAVDRQGRPILRDEITGQPMSEEELGEALLDETHGRIEGRELDYASATTHSWAFWYTVGAIEVTDMAFAVDSILAAVALIGSIPPEVPPNSPHPKLWVVIVGGMAGVILMRFAAMAFIRLLERWPRFETSAYLLVVVIGGKMVLDYFVNTDSRFPVLNFHSVSDPAFWIFWGLMLICFAVGFLPRPKPQ